MMAKRIIYVGNNLRYFFMHRAALARASRDAGYDVHVALPEGEGSDRLCAEGFSFHAVPMMRGKASALAELCTLRSLFRLYRDLKPDLVHHHTVKPVLYGGLSARMACVPAMVSGITGLGYTFLGKGVRARFLRAAVERTYRMALHHPHVRVIFQNPDDRALFVERSLVTEDAAVVIRGSGVDVERFAPKPEAPGTPTVLFVGRLLWDKGVKEYVEAACALRRSGVNARFLLVGDRDPLNPASVPLRTLEAWSEGGAVEWLGWRDDLTSLYAQAHVVCLPSYREGLPRTLLEACACGRAIVATDVPGCREAVADGVNGLLVASKNSETLARALAKLIDDPMLRRRMGEEGRKRAVTEFSEERVAEETLAIYGELLK